jgi:hypothetical protein
MKYKIFLCLGLVLCGLSGLIGNVRGADDLKIMISIPQMDEAQDRWMADHKPVWMRVVNGSYPYPECFVVVENCSSRSLLFFGSTGEGGLLGKLSFEVTCSDGKTTVVKPGFPVASANIPLVQKLDAGQAMVLEFHPGPYAFPFPEQGNTESVTLRAVFEQKPFSFAGGKAGSWGNDAWIGKAISDPCEVLFKR